MLSSTRTEKTIDLALWLFVIILAVIIIAPVFSQPPLSEREDIPVEFTPNNKWVHISHESGVDYVLRTSIIVGFKKGSDSSDGRSSIILSNGSSLSTALGIESFREFVEEFGGTVKKVDLK